MSENKFCVMTNENGIEKFSAPESYENANATASRFHGEGKIVIAVVTEEHANDRKLLNDGVMRMPIQGSVTWGDLVALVDRGRELAMSSGDPVMFVHEEGDTSTIFTVKKADLQLATFTEGSADSAGGTVWFRGTEY
ncbi:hypothetical protein ABT282_08130 [Streptomyces sp. NPDC000927]|uniref:hypothetical protein n=1 Tax=Streptomyces sp. NPDC000927 TaxID=3154371 RepID=UPI00332686CE